MKLSEIPLVLLSILALPAGPASAQIVLYSYDFTTGSGPLNGVAVDTSGATGAQHTQYGTVSGETWTADALFRADGTYDANPASGNIRDSATLSFTPKDGYIYTLSVTTNFDNDAVTGNGLGWHAAGFFATNNWTGDPLGNGDGLSVWGLTQGSGGQQLFFDPNGGTTDAGKVTGTFDTTAPTTLTFVLDTTGGAGNWSAQYYVSGSLERTVSDLDAVEIESVGIGALYAAAGTAAFQSFSLSVDAVETPSPRITSFSSLGGGIWEVTLADGGAAASFEFRSSTTLDFSPGTLVTPLSQANPGTDPGDVDASGDFVTTDTNGDATVRMTLTGSPKDFVRAVSLP
ncbi:hypothetical protein [Haloferula sp. A504]|uniref:hypothetical protein n=1 Tax=Haloferula sp. A504 TaxID=3373601 RepID=UPI0031BECF51|nr:hypothetical protein [Verrucomicrobiaceae bacterium E54]